MKFQFVFLILYKKKKLIKNDYLHHISLWYIEEE